MNNLDKQYLQLVQDILDYGVEKKDRTGTGTKSIFGYTIRHKMSDGFPLLTTKKMAWKTLVTELLWFLRGDTNINYLVDNDCHIWDGDAYKNYRYENFTSRGDTITQEEFINKIKDDDEFAKKWGELGPIYGKQWRSWETFTYDDYANRPKWIEDDPIDQIANLINDLKTNPDSRRLMVSAWNVGELDQMVLPPCHYGFQVYTRELSLKERLNLVSTIIGEEKIRTHEDNLERVDKLNIPTRAISLMWNQRSVDVGLGLPFNIASYGLLLEIIAKITNMVPDELIGNLGDTHIYLNHIEPIKEQFGRELSLDERIKMFKDKTNYDTSIFPVLSETLDFHKIPKRTREPFELPKLVFNNQIHFSDNIDEFLNSCLITDFAIENYQSHPTIKLPLSN